MVQASSRQARRTTLSQRPHSQYASDDGLPASTSRRGNCWDAACGEALFGSLEVERLHDRRFLARRRARDETLAWLPWYDAPRLHSTLNYVSPMQSEEHRGLLEESFSKMSKRILTVCIGNICRSPTAEYLLRERLASRDIQLSSAGLGALAGYPMDATALQLLAEQGIDGAAHRARQLTPAMLREADLVLGMEKNHVDAMVRLAPEASGKIFILDKWLQGRDIPDPYRQQRPPFEHVYGMIAQDIDSWLRYL